VDQARATPILSWVGEHYVRDLDETPEALAARLGAELARKPRRALGVLKVGDEFVGLVAANEFVVWEKAGHATRAHGRIRRRRGGSRVEARIELTRRSRLLIGVFFVLFAVVAAGVLERAEWLALDAIGIGLAVAAGVATAGGFWWTARRQRARLRRFLDHVFSVSDA